MTADAVRQRAHPVANGARVVVGAIWLGGAIFNAAYTLRHPEVLTGYFATSSRLRLYRWFFGDIVAARPVFWMGLVVLGETALGLLTLARGVGARIGLMGGAAWSLFLFPLAWPYTLMMGPYAAIVALLARFDYDASVVNWLDPKSSTI